MKPQHIWPLTEHYSSMMRSPMPVRTVATSAEMGHTDRMVPRGSAEGHPQYGTTITPETLRQIVDTLERLDWVVEIRSFLARQQDPRDMGGEGGLEACEVGGHEVEAMAPGGEYEDPASQEGEYAQPMDPKIRGAVRPHFQAKPSAGGQHEEKPYPWPNVPQSTTYQAAAGPRPKTGPLAERYALERQVAELDNAPGPLNHGERRRILAMAGIKDAEYRDQRAYQAQRARRYCENNPGVSYETAMYRLGIEPPADLVPTS